jgi:hypothetical protein
MARRRRLGWGAALVAWFLLVAATGCDDATGTGESPFRNLGKRGDSDLPSHAARPASR